MAPVDAIPIERAAALEGLSYQRFKKRLQRAGIVLLKDCGDRRCKRVPITALSTTLPLKSRAGALPGSTLTLNATIYACFTDQTGLCTIRTVQWTVPVADGDGQDELSLTYQLPTPLGL